MIDYEQFYFAAPPKSGVDWFCQAMQLAGHGPGFRHQAHQPFNGTQGKPKVSLVCHPYRWLHRIYIASQDGSLNKNDFLLPLDFHQSFSDFVGDYLTHHSGLITELFSIYEADTVFRLEDMPWALEEWLECIGTASDMMRSFRMVNNSELHTNAPSDQLMRMSVVRSEWDFCERYEYF